MKKVVSLLFLLSVLLLFACCTAEASPAEAFLSAVKECDIDAMSEWMTSETASVGDRLREYDGQLDFEERETRKRLYANLSYTIDGEEQTDGGGRTVTVKLIIPDMERILEYANAQILVSGGTANEVIAQMLDDGTVAEDCMTEETIGIHFEQQDGSLHIPYSEMKNAELVRLLSLEEVFRFFALN